MTRSNVHLYFNMKYITIVFIYIYQTKLYITDLESQLYLPRSSAEFGLPPRKRKISQEVDARYENQKTNMNNQYTRTIT